MVDIVFLACALGATPSQPRKLAAPLILAGVRHEVRLRGRLSVWRGSTLVTTYEGNLPRAWRLEVSDIDHDGKPDIVVGVAKKTWNIPFVHTTIFVLSFDGRRVSRKWTGSTMGRPLIDFCTANGVLYTLERRPDTRIELAENMWNGFGFSKVARLGAWQYASDLKWTGTRLTLKAPGGLQVFRIKKEL